MARGGVLWTHTLERRTVAQCARFAGQHRHIVPGVEHRLVPTEAPGMITNQLSVLADGDLGGGVDQKVGAGGEVLAPSADVEERRQLDASKHNHVHREGRPEGV